MKITLISRDLNEKYEVPEKKEITIGRNKEFGFVNDLGIPDLNDKAYKEVSRRHCTLYKAENNLFVVDEGSKNGTYVNGKLILKGKRIKLKNGSKLRLGSHYELEIIIEGGEFQINA